MHEQAYDFVAAAVAEHGPFGRIVEFGSLDINGSVRALFDADYYLGIDVQQGAGVDLVADACLWTADEPYDCVVCCEVFEHTAAWPDLIWSAWRALRDGGTFIVTCAGPGRGAHSAIDEQPIRPTEYYANVDPVHLDGALYAAGFTKVHVEVDTVCHDVRATAHR